MPVSIASATRVSYPEPGDFFSPARRHPEYPFDHLSARANPAYELVRRSLAQAGLDKERFDTPDWNPLGDYIAPGSAVFILCNFVQHRRPRESREAFFAKCIHGSVLRAVSDYALLAVGPEGSVCIGNAAVQSCRFDEVLADTGAAHALDFYRSRGSPVAARDLRCFVSDRTALGRVRSVRDLGSAEDSVEIALGSESLLAEVAGSDERPARFRIADYRPARIEAFHSGGTHRYRIHRALLESDVVIHLSKLKTHEKVGVTCGLKGCVGAVTHKDCLAHYRFGSSAVGGDEYPPALRFLQPVSWLHDRVNARGPQGAFQGPLQILDRSIRATLRRVGARTGGGWSGNDTAWRMALDLARILHYADVEGTMQSAIQRTHLSLVDGIVGGEGTGPLSPQPVPSGVVVFSDDLAWGDRVACRLMGFDPDAVPLVREASRAGRYPLGSGIVPIPEVCFDGTTIPEREIPAVASGPFRPPAGWRAALARS
jgi:uncharacterized protein (DUF362 family)